MLIRRLDRPVLDATGLTGLYVKLEARRESIDVLVIESADRIPVEN